MDGVSRMEKRPSKRFRPTNWTERLVPLILGLLVLALVAILVVIGLSVFGLTPGI